MLLREITAHRYRSRREPINYCAGVDLWVFILNHAVHKVTTAAWTLVFLLDMVFFFVLYFFFIYFTLFSYGTFTVQKTPFIFIYKVVQIWLGQTVTYLHTDRPGHIWTTLYTFMWACMMVEQLQTLQFGPVADHCLRLFMLLARSDKTKFCEWLTWCQQY
jgi:hypothetical protein